MIYKIIHLICFLVIITGCSTTSYISEDWVQVSPNKIAYLGILPYTESAYNPKTKESSHFSYFLTGAMDIKLIDKEFTKWYPEYLNDTIFTKIKKNYPEYEYISADSTSNIIQINNAENLIDSLTTLIVIKELNSETLKNYKQLFGSICELTKADAFFIGNSGVPILTSNRVVLENNYYLIDKNGDIIWEYANSFKTHNYHSSIFNLLPESYYTDNSARILAQESVNYLIRAFPKKINPKKIEKRKFPVLPIVMNEDGVLIVHSLYITKVEILNLEDKIVFKPVKLDNEYIWEYKKDENYKANQNYFIRFDDSEEKYEIVLN